MKNVILLTLSLALTAGSAHAGTPWGWALGPVRQQVGPAIREGSPWTYSAMLYANRRIPPQVKNSWNNPYRGANPWSAELNYWRSMPPEVRNNIVRQQQGYGYSQQGYGYPQQGYQTGYQQQQRHHHHQPSASVTVTVPPPPVYIPGGAAPQELSPTVPVPPPPSELPEIVRPRSR